MNEPTETDDAHEQRQQPNVDRPEDRPVDHRRAAQLADAPPREEQRATELGDVPLVADALAAPSAVRAVGATHVTREARAEDEAASLAEFLPEPFVVTDVYGAIRAANHAAEDLLGRPLYDLVGRPLAGFLPLGARAEFRAGLAGLVRAGTREQWRTSLRGSKDSVPVRLTVGVRRDGLGRATEVRWFIQAQGEQSSRVAESEAESEPRLERTTLGTTPPTLSGKSVWLLSQAGAILSSSFDYERNLRSALELLVPWLADWAILDLLSDTAGARRVAIVRASTEDRAVAMLLARRPASLADAADPVAQVLRGGPPALIASVAADVGPRLVSTAWGRDVMERLAPRSWITVPLRARGRTIGAITFLTARSNRTLGPAQLALAEQFADRAGLAADNARLYEEAMRASEAKSAFLAVMSHELRTPLTAIIGYTELLADGLFGAVSDEQRLQLGRVRESSEHLLRIVEEVLQYARLDARREEPELEELDLAAVLAQVGTMIRPLAERKGLVLRVEGPPDTIRFRSDVGRLRQILVNLLANAVKFTEQGEVRLSVTEQDQHVLFTIHDTGAGIPATLLDRIFEPFFQVDQRFTRRQPGSGLGLSVTKELVTLLGGEITVRSVLGSGSTFTVRLPRTLASPHAPDDSIEERAHHADHRTRNA